MVKVHMKRKSKSKIPSEKSPEFFKVYLPTHSSQRLHIPPAFIEHYNGVVSDKAILKDRLGGFWHVEVEKVQNDFFFQNGWQGFVKDHSLELGDFLIFRYNGNSLFDVKIFGRTGCEKEENLAYRNADSTTSYIKKEEQLEVMETFSKCTYGLKQKHSERGPIKIGKTISSLKKEDQPEAMGTFSKRRGFKRKYSDGGPIGTSKENCGSTRSKRTAAIKVEEDELFKTASVLEPENPHFTAYVKPRRPNELLIPAKVVNTKGFKLEPNMILRDPSGKSWSVRVSVWKNGTVWISRGWAPFCRENNLGKDDRCICEFIRGRGRKGTVIQMHILRAGVGASTLDGHVKRKTRVNK